jgi:hypothetical protein
MSLPRFAALVMLVLLAAIPLAAGQDKKDGKTPADTPALPPLWGKLDLSPDQKKAIAKTQTEYHGRVEALKTMIRKLQEEQRVEMFKVLSKEQKAKLKALQEAKSK